MKWKDLAAELSERSGLSKRQTELVLSELGALVQQHVAAGEEVPLKGIGTVGSQHKKSRTIRSIANNRRMMIGERYVVQFRPSSALKDAASSQGNDLWRTPEHQGAWRTAETLIGDLALYHGAKAPKTLGPDASDEDTLAACVESFGGLWRQVSRTYETEVAEPVRAAHNYLAAAARDRWATT